MNITITILPILFGHWTKCILKPDGSFKTHVTFEHEQKTGKKSVVFLNTKAKNALVLYFNSLGQYKMSDWLFPNGKNPTESMSEQEM